MYGTPILYYCSNGTNTAATLQPRRRGPVRTTDTYNTGALETLKAHSPLMHVRPRLTPYTATTNRGNQDFRKRLRKYAHLASSLERAKALEAREHLHGICQAFGRFLGEATEFYASLLRRFEAMHHQYAKSGGGGGSDSGRSSSSGSAGGGGGGEQRRSGLMKLVVLSINRCLIFLGDLARYRELHGENSVKDWSTAERFYHQV